MSVVPISVVVPTRDRCDVLELTLRTILGQRGIPGLLDHYLARRAWDGQFTDDLPPAAYADPGFAQVRRQSGRE